MPEMNLSSEDIDVDDAGRVIVTNPELAASLREADGDEARKKKITITNKGCPITNQACGKKVAEPGLGLGLTT